jgi:hypothetical protein
VVCLGLGKPKKEKEKKRKKTLQHLTQVSSESYMKVSGKWKHQRNVSLIEVVVVVMTAARNKKMQVDSWIINFH